MSFFEFGYKSLSFRAATCGSPMNLPKILEVQLTDTRQQNALDKQRIENQKTELKNLNSKGRQVTCLNNEVNKLKKMLKTENEKTKLAKELDIEQYKMQISNLEWKIRAGINRDHHYAQEEAFQ